MAPNYEKLRKAGLTALDDATLAAVQAACKDLEMLLMTLPAGLYKLAVDVQSKHEPTTVRLYAHTFPGAREIASFELTMHGSTKQVRYALSDFHPLAWDDKQRLTLLRALPALVEAISDVAVEYEIDVKSLFAYRG